MYYSYDNTRKTWNTNFISVCQNLIGLYSWNLKKTYFFFGLHGLVFDLETIGSFLDYDLKADIWEKTISILTGNLNSGFCYLITTVRQSVLADRCCSNEQSFRPRVQKSESFVFSVIYKCNSRRFISLKFCPEFLL